MLDTRTKSTMDRVIRFAETYGMTFQGSIHDVMEFYVPDDKLENVRRFFVDSFSYFKEFDQSSLTGFWSPVTLSKENLPYRVLNEPVWEVVKHDILNMRKKWGLSSSYETLLSGKSV